MSRICLPCLLLILGVITACQRQPETPNAATASANSKPVKAVAKPEAQPDKSGNPFASLDTTAPALPATGSDDFKILSVSLGSNIDSEHRVLAEQDQFTPTDTIYAAVVSTGKHQGLKLSAKWTGPDNAVVADTQQALAPISATITTFSVHNPDGWPTGKYQLVIALNGQDMQTRSFEVR